MKLFITDTREDLKCGGCNWRVSTFFGIGDTVEQARSNFDDEEGYGKGLCSQCIAELLTEEQYEIHNNS